MVARTPPPKIMKMVAPLNPILLRETVNKVDKCMSRLQELQYTVTGGTQLISGVSFSPRSTRGYLRTSLRCKQESARARNYTPRKSRTGKLPAKNTGEWRRMSLPAMLLGETVGEILQASQFAKEMVAAVAPNSYITTLTNDPKTPITIRRNQRQNPENSELRARRKREKQPTLQSIRSESDVPRLLGAKSRINFKVSPPRKIENDKENCRCMTNRVSPRNKPLAKKTVIFRNPLFHSLPASNHQNFGGTTSPVITKNRQTPHKFLVKSPASASKFQVKIKSPPICLSPTRASSLSKKSPKVSTAAKLHRSLSPSRLASRLVSPAVSASKFQVKIKNPPICLSPTRASSLSKKSPKVSTAAKLRRSFSPSRLASRLVSPLKSRKSFVQKSDGMRIMMSGLKQRPQNSTPMKFFSRRI